VNYSGLFIMTKFVGINLAIENLINKNHYSWNGKVVDVKRI